MSFEGGNFNNSEQISKPEKIEEEYSGTREEHEYLKGAYREIRRQINEAIIKKAPAEEIENLKAQLQDLGEQRNKSWAKKEEKLETLDPAVKEEYKNIDNQIREFWRHEIEERNKTGEIITPLSPHYYYSRMRKIEELELKRRELEQKHNL